MSNTLKVIFLLFLAIGLTIGLNSEFATADKDKSGLDGGDSGSSGSGDSGSSDGGSDSDSSGSDSDSSDDSKKGGRDYKGPNTVSDDGDSGDDSSGSSDGTDDSSKGSKSGSSDSQDDKGTTVTKETQIVTDEQGREIEIKTRTRTKDGETDTKETRSYVNEDGNKVTISTKTEIKDGEEEVKTSIKVKGAEVNTKLFVKTEMKEDQTTLKVRLLTGSEQDIIVQPDEALQTAFEELQATTDFIFELKEAGTEGEGTAVFSAKATIEGKLLGIFNTQVDLETLIDTETGEVIQTDRPWWAFMVVGADESNVCHFVDETTVSTLTVSITEVKDHLAHGDGVGECVAVCDDGILVEGVEACETEDEQACETAEGYAGTETCNAVCDGFDMCITTESCGDAVLNGPEICELSETQACTTAEGYSGTQTCLASCAGFDTCTTTESCGDGVVNGLEACDDGNAIDGDGCDSLCQIEVVEEPAPEPAP